MAKHLKFWATLGAAAVSSALQANALPAQVKHQMHLLQFAAATAGDAGEAGESGGAAMPAGQGDFIASLALVEGHMRVGLELYKQGKSDAATVHMKHPADELYATLIPKLEARKVKGFADELEALSMAIHHNAPATEIDALFDKMHKAIVSARGEGEMVSAHEMTEAVHILMRSAVADYAVGVVGQDVKVPKEYQDAWGFTQAAKALMADISATEREEHTKELTEIDEALKGLDTLWPDLVGEKKIDADARLLAIAAAKVELAGLGIK
jgi:hypothetical protein